LRAVVLACLFESVACTSSQPVAAGNHAGAVSSQDLERFALDSLDQAHIAQAYPDTAGTWSERFYQALELDYQGAALQARKELLHRAITVNQFSPTPSESDFAALSPDASESSGEAHLELFSNWLDEIYLAKKSAQGADAVAALPLSLCEIRFVLQYVSVGQMPNFSFDAPAYAAYQSALQAWAEQHCDAYAKSHFYLYQGVENLLRPTFSDTLVMQRMAENEPDKTAQNRDVRQARRLEVSMQVVRRLLYLPPSQAVELNAAFNDRFLLYEHPASPLAFVQRLAYDQPLTGDAQMMSRFTEEAPPTFDSLRAADPDAGVLSDLMLVPGLCANVDLSTRENCPVAAALRQLLFLHTTSFHKLFFAPHSALPNFKGNTTPVHPFTIYPRVARNFAGAGGGGLGGFVLAVRVPYKNLLTLRGTDDRARRWEGSLEDTLSITELAQSKARGDLTPSTFDLAQLWLDTTTLYHQNRLGAEAEIDKIGPLTDQELAQLFYFGRTHANQQGCN